MTDVCLEVGFSSLGSFSDLFARRVGSFALGVPAPRAVAVAVPGSASSQSCFPGA